MGLSVLYGRAGGCMSITLWSVGRDEFGSPRRWRMTEAMRCIVPARGVPLGCTSEVRWYTRIKPSGKEKKVQVG